MITPQMWTFTLVPGQWAGGPGEAYDYVKAHRCVAEWVRSMYNAGYLRTKHFFSAEEFQVGERKVGDGPPTLMVHFHVLVDVQNGYLPYHYAQARWNRFKPASAVKLGDWRDETFGRIQYDAIDSMEGIAKYVCKYIAKGPKCGLPAWFEKRLDAGGNLTGYTTSKGFWKWAAGEIETPGVVREQKTTSQPPGPKRNRRPWRERINACGGRAMVVKVTAKRELGVEGWTHKRCEYMGEPDFAPFAELAAYVGATDAELNKGAVVISNSVKGFTYTPYGVRTHLETCWQSRVPWKPIELEPWGSESRQESFELAEGAEAGRRTAGSDKTRRAAAAGASAVVNREKRKWRPSTTEVFL